MFVNAKFLLLLIVLVGLTACSTVPISQPFTQLVDNELLEKEQTLLVIVTEAVVNDDSESQRVFSDHVNKVLDNIDQQPGLYGYAIRKELFGNSAWTMTVWVSNDAVNGFRNSPYHLPAMVSAPSVLKSSRFFRTKMTVGDDPMDWDQALALLQREGRSYRY